MYLGVGAGAPFNRQPQGPGTPPMRPRALAFVPAACRRFEMLAGTDPVAEPDVRTATRLPYTGRHYQLVRSDQLPKSFDAAPAPAAYSSRRRREKTMPLSPGTWDACTPSRPAWRHTRATITKAGCPAPAIGRRGRDYARSRERASAPVRSAEGDGGEHAAAANSCGNCRAGFAHAMVAPRGPWTEPDDRRGRLDPAEVRALRPDERALRPAELVTATG